MDNVEYKGKEIEITYLHEPKYGDKGELTVAYVNLPYNKYLIGIAERSDRDRYDLDLAKKVAKGRLVKKIKERQ